MNDPIFNVTQSPFVSAVDSNSLCAALIVHAPEASDTKVIWSIMSLAASARRCRFDKSCKLPVVVVDSSSTLTTDLTLLLRIVSNRILVTIHRHHWVEARLRKTTLDRTGAHTHVLVWYW